MNIGFLAQMLRIGIQISLFFILLGCASVPPGDAYRGPFPRPGYLDESFSYQKSNSETIELKGDHRQITLTVDSWGMADSSPLVIDYYLSPLPRRCPAILVSPPLGGNYKIAAHFARYYSQRGYHCLVVHRPKDLTRDVVCPEDMDVRLHDAVIRDRLALDWLCARPEVDPLAIGSFGISYGAIKNVVLAGLDERLKANVIAMAGADLASLLMHSNHKAMRRIRTTMPGWQDNPSMVEEQVREHLMDDPLRFTPYIDPDTTLLILARFDHTVPRANGEILRQALGVPQTIYLPSGHYSSALFTGLLGFPYIETQTLAFFDKHLKPGK